eukprot:2036440-Rhodomonas_salina.1
MVFWGACCDRELDKKHNEDIAKLHKKAAAAIGTAAVGYVAKKMKRVERKKENKQYIIFVFDNASHRGRKRDGSSLRVYVV